MWWLARLFHYTALDAFDESLFVMELYILYAGPLQHGQILEKKVFLRLALLVKFHMYDNY